MIAEFEATEISWYSALLKWRYRDTGGEITTTGGEVVLMERSGDHTKSMIHYRGRKREYSVVGLSPNTTYTFTLYLDYKKMREKRREGTSEKIETQIQDNPNPDVIEEEDTAEHEKEEATTQPPTTGTQLSVTTHTAIELSVTTHTATELSVTTHTATELSVTFRTDKCGNHDARLVAAIENQDMAEVRRVCTESPEVVNIADKSGVTPLMVAAVRGYPSIIRILERAGGNLDQTNPGGKTALMLAAYHGHPHVITTLMELACNWSKQDNSGCTALHYSVERGSIDISRTLISNGADVNLADSRGYTCLMSLCLSDREDVEMARFLLENKADPNLNSQNGETTLMAAARTNKPELAELLIEHGAIVKMKTRYGYTALDMTKQGSICHEVVSQYFSDESESEKDEDDFSSWISNNAR